MDAGCTTGGILKLCELILDHPAELSYDFRSRFQLSIYDIGGHVSYLEAILLVSVLMRDPSSWLQAAANDWKHPVSFEWMVQTNTYDLHAAINSKRKAKPYPTPWQSPDTNRIGSKKRQKRADVLAALERMNPKENDG